MDIDSSGIGLSPQVNEIAERMLRLANFGIPEVRAVGDNIALILANRPPNDDGCRIMQRIFDHHMPLRDKSWVKTVGEAVNVVKNRLGDLPNR